MGQICPTSPAHRIARTAISRPVSRGAAEKQGPPQNARFFPSLEEGRSSLCRFVRLAVAPTRLVGRSASQTPLNCEGRASRALVPLPSSESDNLREPHISFPTLLEPRSGQSTSSAFIQSIGFFFPTLRHRSSRAQRTRSIARGPRTCLHECVIRRILAIVGSAIFLVLAPGFVAGMVPWDLVQI